MKRSQHSLTLYISILALLAARTPALIPCGSSGRSATCTRASPVIRQDNVNEFAAITTAELLTPSPRAYHSLAMATHPVTQTEFMVLFGGCQDEAYIQQDVPTKRHGVLGDTWIYDVVQHLWLSGYDSLIGHTDALCRYNVTFKAALPQPTPRFAHACAATCSTHEIVCFGGLFPVYSIKGTCQDGALAKLSTPSLQLTNEVVLLTASMDGKLRMWNFPKPSTITAEELTAVLPPNANASLATPTIPRARAGHTLTRTDDFLISFGGLVEESGGLNSVDVVRELLLLPCTTTNASRVTWVSYANGDAAPPARHSHSAVLLQLPSSVFGRQHDVLQNTVLVFGGTDSREASVRSNTRFFNDVWALDLSTLTWVELTPASSMAPPGRQSHDATATRSGKLFIHGGATGTGNHQRDSWLFDPITRLWSKLTPWFTPGNALFEPIVRATDDNLQHRDRWGHRIVAVSNPLQEAESFLIFGGYYSELYYPYVTDELTQFFQGAAPFENLSFWARDAFNGPFQRVEHTSTLRGEPDVTAYERTECRCSREAWQFEGSWYAGCARPVGLEDYICPLVSADNCAAQHCWQANADASDMTWAFCGFDEMLVFGGAYDGDADHITVADPPGSVWSLDLLRFRWEMSELTHLPDGNTPAPVLQHTMSRLSAYPVGGRLPAKGLIWEPQEQFITFAGQAADRFNRSLFGGLYLFTPPETGTTSSWQRLDPRYDPSMSGVKLNRAGHAAAVISRIDDNGLVSSILYVFGGYYMKGWAERVAVQEPSLFVMYDVGANAWSRVAVGGGATPAPRFFSSLVAVNIPVRVLVLFGGEVAEDRARTTLDNDVWLFWLDKQEWTTLRKQTPMWPSPREGHLGVVFGSKAIYYGGKIIPTNDTFLPTDSSCAELDIVCSSCELWALDVGMIVSAAAGGGATGGVESEGALPGDPWMLLSSRECDETTTPKLRHADGVVAQGKLAMFGGFQGTQGKTSNEIHTVAPGCVNGTQAHSYYTDSCLSCPIGSYSPSSGHHCCLVCSPHTTTSSTGNTVPTACALCAPDFCFSGGVCDVDEAGTATCACRFGYLALDSCKVPWLYISIATAAVLALLVTGSVMYYRRNKRMQLFRQAQLAQTQREVEEFSRGWEICPDDLTLEKRIDDGAIGACGEVWAGKWQDSLVAIKLLNRDLLESDAEGYTAEFDKEVRFMRSIHHPHLVLFFGAGKLRNGRPFLVTEYCEYGSLQTFLRNEKNDIGYALKVRFATDAAKGMRFLHYANPPRIHRDLKTANLLVSQMHVVKVSDFGTSRLIDTQPGALAPPSPMQMVRRSSALYRTPHSEDDEHVPLLQASPSVNGTDR